MGNQRISSGVMLRGVEGRMNAWRHLEGTADANVDTSIIVPVPCGQPLTVTRQFAQFALRRKGIMQALSAE